MTNEQRMDLEEIRAEGSKEYCDRYIRRTIDGMSPAQQQMVRDVMYAMVDAFPPEMGPAERLRFIYESITQGVRYTKEVEEGTDRLYRHTFLSALLDQKAVCQGIAELIHLYCLLLNIPELMVIGTVRGEKEGLHAWNMVYLEIGGVSSWYHLDATADLGQSRLRYFLRTDREIGRDHEYLKWVYPRAERKAPALRKPSWEQLQQVGDSYSERLDRICKKLKAERTA